MQFAREGGRDTVGFRARRALTYLLVVAAASLFVASVGPAAVQRPGRGARSTYVPLPPFARLDRLRGDRVGEHDQFKITPSVARPQR